eukprot:COSAG02_NODE_10173_length_2003_cov_1.652836_2_plen_250_part_00
MAGKGGRDDGSPCPLLHAVQARRWLGVHVSSRPLRGLLLVAPSLAVPVLARLNFTAPRIAKPGLVHVALVGLDRCARGCRCFRNHRRQEVCFFRPADPATESLLEAQAVTASRHVGTSCDLVLARARVPAYPALEPWLPKVVVVDEFLECSPAPGVEHAVSCRLLALPASRTALPPPPPQATCTRRCHNPAIPHPPVPHPQYIICIVSLWLLSLSAAANGIVTTRHQITPHTSREMGNPKPELPNGKPA